MCKFEILKVKRKFKEMIEGGGSAIAYAWYILEKGCKGETILKWFN